MVQALLDRNYAVHAVDVESDPSIDARDFFRWDTRVFDLVVHCAYKVGGRAAIDGEPRLLARNLELDAAMFDWAVRTGQKRVLYFSSSAAYPLDLQWEGSEHRLAESDISTWAEEPDGRYGFAKLTGERMSQAAAESGLPVHVVRPFSGYGEDQSLDYPFPSFIDRAKRRVDPFPIWGPGTQVRDWIHVDDVIAGALAVVDADYRKPVNLCTGVGTSMLDLAALACSTAGYSPTFATNPGAPTGVAYRVGDPTRMSQFYVPKVSIEEGVARAMAAVRA